MVELLHWNRLSDLGLLRDCVTLRNAWTHRASSLMEVEMDGVILFLPRLQVCGSDSRRGRTNKADVLKRCRWWHW